MTRGQASYAGALNERTVLVTGAGGGLGAATAAGLVRAGARVLVHARSDQLARAAVDRLAESTSSGRTRPDDVDRLVPVAGDLSSLAGVHHLAAQVKHQAPAGLHVLVNNAGAAFAQRALTPDGIERTVAINHLAVAALTTELFELLRRGATATGVPSRVVNLSSVVEKRGKPVTDWTYPTGYSQLQAYSDSKLLSLAYTYSLARRWRAAGITVNAANPGSVGTGFGTKAGGLLRVAMSAGRLFMASADRGARTSVRLAADPALATATGGYYVNAAESASSARSRDVDFGEEVRVHTHAVLEGGHP